METAVVTTELSSRRRHTDAAGLVTWALVGAPVALSLVQGREMLSDPAVAGWIAVYAAFGAALWFSAWRWREALPLGMRRGLVLAQAAAGAAANALIPLPMPGMPIGGILLVVAAAKGAEVFPPRGAMALAAGLTAAALAAFRLHWPWTPALATAAAYGAFVLFACMAGLLAKSEERARRELAASLASLRETQAMLAQNAAIAERARIDRELHDVLGHHLVVLSLNLQTAAGMCEGRARELVRGAHGLTRLILSDLRSMVREHGEVGPVDLRGAVERLAASIPGVEVRASVAEGVGPLEPAVAHAIFRCVQEFLTNTLKHAAASRAGVEITRANGSVRLEASDDGRGARIGGGGEGGEYGLGAMRGRIEALGGTLEVSSEPGAGFRIVATVPSGGRA